MPDHANHTIKLLTRRKMARASLTIVVGTAAAVMAAAGTAHAGYGACSKDNCPAYSGNAELCANCGHHYRDHW